jgi:Outer membrane receptor for ferrienterochelin and colicins
LSVFQLDRFRVAVPGRRSMTPVCLAFAVSVASAADIETIIVTAQKREQNIQDIPVAVTALSGERLTQLTISDVFDLQQSVPSLLVRQNQVATTSTFSIRGVGTSGSNFGLESSVGLYVDGVYRARQNSMINEMVDIEAVEVLRGPQGTLFGRNTPSGAVLMKTVAPQQEFGGYLDGTLGNYGLWSLNGAVGGPIIEDKLAYRFTGFTTQRDGHVDEFNTGDDIINDRDRFGGRLQFLYTSDDTFSARLILDYSEIDEVCCGNATVRNNYVVHARDSRTGEFAAELSPGTDTILGTPSYYHLSRHPGLRV